MMPEPLIRFGLDTSLRDFCNDINQSGALQITYQSIGFESEKLRCHPQHYNLSDHTGVDQ